MTDRPLPMTLPGGDFVIPGDPAALRTLVLALRRFQTSAPSLRGWRTTLLAAAEEADAQAQERVIRQCGAAGAVPSPAVVGPAQALAVSEGLGLVITAAEAGDLTGLSAERWRQLAVSGTIRGRRTGRRVWELNRDDVMAYDEQRRRRRGNGSDKALEAEGPGGWPSDGPSAA